MMLRMLGMTAGATLAVLAALWILLALPLLLTLALLAGAVTALYFGRVSIAAWIESRTHQHVHRGYPRGFVLGVVDPDALPELRADLVRAGFFAGAVRRFAPPTEEPPGPSDLSLHGLIEGEGQHELGDEPDLADYASAAEDGWVVIGVRAPEAHERTTVATIFASHRARDVNYCGVLSMESAEGWAPRAVVAH